MKTEEEIIWEKYKEIKIKWVAKDSYDNRFYEGKTKKEVLSKLKGRPLDLYPVSADDPYSTEK